MSDQASFLGLVIRKIVRRFIRIYYPVIHVTHPERLPKEGATLYIANHSNSLIDPVVIGITANRPVRFLAKAPLFTVPVLGTVMKAIGMIPAYRGQDDKSSSSVRRNVESLNVAGENLAKGLPMGIFPEGKSHDLVHMEQVKTGAARIAQRAVESIFQQCLRRRHLSYITDGSICGTVLDYHSPSLSTQYSKLWSLPKQSLEP